MGWEVYLGLLALLSDSQVLEHGWRTGQAVISFQN